MGLSGESIIKKFSSKELSLNNPAQIYKSVREKLFSMPEDLGYSSEMFQLDFENLALSTDNNPLCIAIALELPEILDWLTKHFKHLELSS